MIIGNTFPANAFLVFLAVLLAIRLGDSFLGVFPQSLLAAFLFLYAPVPRYWKKGLPAWIHRTDAKKTLGQIFLFVFAGAVIYFVFLRIPLPSGMLPPERTAPFSPFLAAQFLLLAAFPEEVFFRGYLYDAFEEAGWEPVLPTSLLFAFAHVAMFPSPYRALTFFPGLIFGWGRKVSGNIYIPIAVHFLYNLFLFVPGMRP